jgi:hypothetical protein
MFRPESALPNPTPQRPVSQRPSSDWPDQPNRPIYAWLASIALHTVLLILVSVATNRTLTGLENTSDNLRSGPTKTAMDDTQEEAVLVVAHRTTNTPPTAHEHDSAPNQPTGGSGAANDSSSPLTPKQSIPPGFALPIDLDAALAEMIAAADPGAISAFANGNSLGQGGLGNLGINSGDGDSDKPGDRGLKAAGGGSAAASLFGITGNGNRIVYVVDRSDSMNGNGGRPLLAAKKQLIESLGALKPSQFFQFIFYNDQARPYQDSASAGAVQMIQAEPRAIASAQSYVESVNAFGGTNHIDALRLALRMRPDVIFFLTDGLIPSLSSRELDEVARIANSYHTTIHGIEFGTSPAADPTSFMPRLAANCGGKYRYFDVTQFSTTGTSTWESKPNR